jgi:hypothetical protein
MLRYFPGRFTYLELPAATWRRMFHTRSHLCCGLARLGTTFSESHRCGISIACSYRGPDSRERLCVNFTESEWTLDSNAAS